MKGRGRGQTWHGCIPGKLAQVGLIRLSAGLCSAARTTCSLKAASYVMRFLTRVCLAAGRWPLVVLGIETPVRTCSSRCCWLLIQINFFNIFYKKCM